ncbi:MAG TPA: hypothetical protein VGF21_19460, partial [Thermoleophilaceae bacterium]
MRRPTAVVALAGTLALALAGTTLAADSDLDPSFSGDGTAVSSAGSLGNAIAIEGNGKIVEVGSDIGVNPDSAFIVTRTNADG